MRGKGAELGPRGYEFIGDPSGGPSHETVVARQCAGLPHGFCLQDGSLASDPDHEKRKLLTLSAIR